MTNGTAYLTDGFTNSATWKLCFDMKFTGNNGCGILLIVPNTYRRDYKEIQFSTYGSINPYVNGTIVNQNIFFVDKYSYNEWMSVEIIKNNSNTVTMTVNGESTDITWSYFSSLSQICIGVDTWGSYVPSLRNVRIKPL